jgi:lactoylglutathione lyase
MFNELFPIMSTPDLGRSLAFYQGLLDAQIEYQFPPDGEAGYVGLKLGSTAFGLGLDPAATQGPDGQRCWLWVYADDCDAAVDRLRTAGVSVLEPPEDQPWGERVAKVLDPDGNIVIIGAKAAS